MQLQIQWRPLLRLEGLPPAVVDELSQRQRVLASRADLTVFLSRSELAEGIAALAVSPERAVLVPNAVPMARFENPRPRLFPWRGHGPVVVMGGRLDEKMKGLDLGFSALAELATDTDFRLLLIGREPPMEHLPAALRDRTTTSPWLTSEQMGGALAAADLLLLPSLYEPFGMLVVEAQAVGLPVVALDHHGPRDIIVHQQTGLLVPAEAPLQPLVAALRRLIANDSLRTEMGARATQRVLSHYTLAGLVSRFTDLYKTLTAG